MTRFHGRLLPFGLLLTVAVAPACGGGGSSTPAATATQEHDGTAETPVASTTSTPTATPAASPSPTAVIIDGVEAKPLTLGYEQPVPPRTVVFFTQVRPQSHTTNVRLWRAHRYANDELQIDDLTAPLRERSAVGADPYTLAMSEDGSTIMAGVCVEQASCGVGIMRPREPGEAIPASLQTGPDGIAFRSTDGGASWAEVGVLPYSHRLVAVVPEGTIVARGFDSATTSTQYSWYETGETIDPPIEHGWPEVVPGLGLTWRSNTSDNGPVVDATGAVVHEPVFPGSVGETLVAVHPDGSRLVVSLSDDSPEGTWVLASVGRDGRVTHAVTAEFVLSRDIPPAPRFGPTFLVIWGVVKEEPRYLPYLVDVRYFGASPMLELMQVVHDHMSPLVMRMVDYGQRPLRVNTPGSCLNVRAEPSPNAVALTCAAHGVLLRDLSETSGDWLRVGTPDGTSGWAAVEFIVR